MSLQVVKSDDSWETPSLGKEEGSAFGWTDRFFYGYRDGAVFDYSDWEARDLQEMLNKDYRARQIENVLSLPIINATRTMTPAKGDNGEFEWLQQFWETDSLNGGCETSLDLIVDQMTTAITYKKAFWEIVWDIGQGDFEGKVVPKKYAWRPQTTCRLMREPKTGNLLGFEQEPYYTGPDIASGIFPIKVPANRSFIYLHGARRDPINGISDMEVPYWAWKTKQKILLLWFTFLEGVALPRQVVMAREKSEASQIAGQLARAKNSGVIGIGADDPKSVNIQTLDMSGKGADQFQAALTWLDQCATGSVLADFLDLSKGAVGGTGSYALSKDASDFFLQSLGSKTREMAYCIRRDLFAPIVRYNFGPSAVVPNYVFEPLNAEDKSDAVTMLTDLMRSRDPALVPDEFIGELARMVSDYMGMDGDKVFQQFETAAAEAKKAAAENAASQQAQQVAALSGAVNSATRTVGPKPPSVAGINTPPLPSFY